MGEPFYWLLGMSVALYALAGRLSGRPYPRLAAACAYLASLVLSAAAFMLISGFVREGAGRDALLLGLVIPWAFAWWLYRRARKKRAAEEQAPEEPAEDQQVPLWRRADVLLRRFDELSVNFDRPSSYDLGSWRADQTWNDKFARFMEALEGLEQAIVDAPLASYDEYASLCRSIRDVLSASVQEPKGKGHYLNLQRSNVIDRLKVTVRRDRSREAALSAPSPSVELENDDGKTYLRVRNIGIAADFWASLEVEGMVDVPKKDIFARWAHTQSIRAIIPKGGSNRLYLARTAKQLHVPAATRLVQYATDAGTFEGNCLSGWLHGDAYERTAPGTRILLTITLFSDPPLIGDRLTAGVRFEGVDVELLSD